MTSDDNAETGTPPSIELAWGRRDLGRRGPKRGLTLERIVAAGIQVAVTEGVAALSMARIASELGVGTMSLYRYVAAKNELLELMVDAGLGPPPPSSPGEDWRAGLRRWAQGVRDAYRRHPWSLRVPISAPPLAPNNVPWLDNGVLDDDDEIEVEFEFGLERILDGIGALVASKRGAAGSA